MKTLYTTYRLLAGSSITTQAQGLTGAITAYGIDTPIYLSDLASAGLLQTAMSAMPYSVGAWIPTAQLIAVKMIEQYLYIFNDLFPGDSRAQRLTYFIENKINGINVVPDGQILDLATTLTTMADQIPKNGAYTTYNLLVQNFGPIEGEFLDEVRRFFGITLSDASLANPIIDNTFGNILSTVRDPYPLKDIMEAISEQQYITDTFNYNTTHNQEMYYEIQLHNPSPPTGLYSYQAYASNWITKALSLAATQTVYGSGSSISGIYASLRNAQSEYNNWQQYTLRPILSEINQSFMGRVPIQGASNPTVRSYAKLITDAGLNYRAQLLSDYNYVLPFDTNGSNQIEEHERVLMEQDVQTKMLTFRATTALDPVNQLNDTFIGYSSIPDGLVDIFVTYS